MLETLAKKCALAGLSVIFLSGCTGSSIHLHRLSKHHITVRRQVLDRLEPVIEHRRQQGDLATLTFDDLTGPLSGGQKRFVKSFLKINPEMLQSTRPYCNPPVQGSDFVILRDQLITENDGAARLLPPQFLPRPVYEAFMRMTEQMKKDIGRTVYVESGYRSPAYQLYLFLYYLENHDYSVQETSRFVAWPGYSEHGCPPRQAVDIITENGINGQTNPSELEATEEYQWMLKNAHRFGFELSYPKESPTSAYEPWHWRCTQGG